MTAPQPRRAAPSWRDTARPWLTPAVALLLIAVAAATAIGLFGGWESVEERKTQELPVVAVGEAMPASPFTITVTEAYWAQEVPPRLFAITDQRWLVVETEVTTTTPSPMSREELGQALVWVTDEEPRSPESVFRSDDPLWQQTVQPGMTKTWLFAWPLPHTAELPTELTLRTLGQTYRPSSLGDRSGWFDPTPSGEIVVPLPQQERTW